MSALRWRTSLAGTTGSAMVQGAATEQPKQPLLSLQSSRYLRAQHSFSPKNLQPEFSGQLFLWFHIRTPPQLCPALVSSSPLCSKPWRTTREHTQFPSFPLLLYFSQAGRDERSSSPKLAAADCMETSQALMNVYKPLLSLAMLCLLHAISFCSIAWPGLLSQRNPEPRFWSSTLRHSSRTSLMDTRCHAWAPTSQSPLVSSQIRVTLSSNKSSMVTATSSEPAWLIWDSGKVTKTWEPASWASSKEMMCSAAPCSDV